MISNEELQGIYARIRRLEADTAFLTKQVTALVDRIALLENLAMQTPEGRAALVQARRQ